VTLDDLKNDDELARTIEALTEAPTMKTTTPPATTTTTPEEPRMNTAPATEWPERTIQDGIAAGRDGSE
jgi:hypothetical protein